MKKSLALSHSLYGLSLLSGCGSGSSASFPLLTIPTASLPNAHVHCCPGLTCRYGGLRFICEA
jgi:hypothetical protein